MGSALFVCLHSSLHLYCPVSVLHTLIISVTLHISGGCIQMLSLEHVQALISFSGM